MFSPCFMLFPTLNKKVKKNISGRGCSKIINKINKILSRFMLFSTLTKNIEKCPFTYWLNGRWFHQIVDRDSWNLYPLYPLFPCSDFVTRLGGGGGGVMFFSYFMLFTTFL